MNDMTSAPKTGERILLHYTIIYYSGPAGTKWEECWWDKKYLCDYPVKMRGRWTSWCGNYHIKSTETITKPLGWLPLPAVSDGDMRPLAMNANTAPLKPKLKK